MEEIGARDARNKLAALLHLLERDHEITSPSAAS